MTLDQFAQRLADLINEDTPYLKVQVRELLKEYFDRDDINSRLDKVL